MHVAFNQSTICYLVEAYTPGRTHLFFFRLDQAVPAPGDRKAKERVTNQVEKHLNHLHRKTGLVYHLVYWSDPVRFTAYLKEKNIELD